MSIERKYQRAMVSTNLSHSHSATAVTDTDVLTAYGMSHATLGLALLRLHSQWDGSPIRIRLLRNQEEDARNAVQHLRSLPAVLRGVTQHAQRLHVPDPEAMARVAVEHWLNALCMYCKGTGQILVGDARVLVCKHCAGERHRTPPNDPILRRLLNIMDDCQQAANTAARKRLWG